MKNSKDLRFWDESQNIEKEVYVNLKSIPESEYRRLFYGEFKPDSRYVALVERYVRYCREKSRDDSGFPRRLFELWCSDRKYTTEEINQVFKGGFEYALCSR